MSNDTIYALSSGAGLSGVAVIRICGPHCCHCLEALCGAVPEARRASLRRIIDPADGRVLDTALVLFFAGPASFTGEDCAEFHVHGGAAVVKSVLGALGRVPGLRPAMPGEFARRAFDNGKIDLLMAEGLADLIEAETSLQQQQALFHAQGLSSDIVGEWRTAMIGCLAGAEAAIDFIDEPGVAESALARIRDDIVSLRMNLQQHLAAGHKGEIIRDGVRVTIAGPPNAGKSSLLNRLAGRDAAIVTEIPGTTRDIVEVSLDLDGVPVIFCDTAGLRAEAGDAVESIGMERSRQSMGAADLVLWLAAPDIADPGLPPEIDSKALRIHSKCDLETGDGCDRRAPGGMAISARTGEGMDELLAAIHSRVTRQFDLREPAVAVRERHRQALAEAIGHLDAAMADGGQPVEGVAESLRMAARALGSLTGHVGVEDILDSIFSRFCIGK